MIKKEGNILDYYNQGYFIVLETHGEVREDGSYIVGYGTDLDIVKKLPQVPYTIGEKIKKIGNHCMALIDSRVVTFPTRAKYKDKANIALIERSASELPKLRDEIDTHFLNNQDKWTPEKKVLCIPKIGVENGADWKEVSEILQEYLKEDERFWIIVSEESSEKKKEIDELLGEKVVEQKKEIGHKIFTPSVQFDENILPAFRCPRCNKLIEVVDDSDEYFSIYGNIMLGEIGGLIGGNIEKFGVLRPFRMCFGCLPEFLKESKEKL